MMILKNCKLIKELTEGYDEDIADIVIDDKIILDICKPGIIKNEQFDEIDLSDCTLLPAFFDMHCHLFLKDLKQIEKLNTQDEAYSFANALEFSKEYLKQGFTTLRDAGTAHNVTVKLKALADNKYVYPIPDIISSCKALTPTNPSNAEYSGMYEVCDGKNEVCKSARKQFEAGADVIKYMASGCFLDEHGVPGMTITTESELRAAVEIAEMRGSYVMAHAHGADSIKKALNSGVYTIEHGSFIDEEAIDYLINGKSFLIPTGGIGLACMSEEGSAALSDAMYEKSRAYESIEKRCVDKAYSSGIKMGFGSDVDMASFVRTPGIEFKARTDWYHFKPIDILLQATKFSSEILGISDQKGSVKKGKKSELVAIKGDPLKDFNVMNKLPEYVFFKGNIIKNK